MSFNLLEHYTENPKGINRITKKLINYIQPPLTSNGVTVKVGNDFPYTLLLSILTIHLFFK